MEIKERIREKAEELFRVYGIRSVTMDEIANHLGVSKKTIYQSFSDKSGLVDEVTRETLEKSRKNCEYCKKEAKDAVHEIVLTIGTLKEIMDQMNPSVLFDLERGYPGSYKRFLDFMYDYLYDVIVENLQWGKEEGLFREDINESVYAKVRLGTIPIPFNEKMFPKSKYVLFEVKQEIHKMFLYSVVSAKGQKLIEKYFKEEQAKTTNPK